MSSTTTITTPTEVEKTRVYFLELSLLPLEKQVQNSLKTAIKNILSSHLFDSTMQQQIAAWEEKFTQEKLKKIESEKERMEASYGFCFLVCKIIRPAMDSHKGHSENLSKLHAFEADVKDILKLTLPEKTHADELIESYGKSIEKLKTLKASLQEIDESSQKQTEQLTHRAKQSIKKLDNQTELVKEHLQKQLLQIQAVHQRVNTLTKNVYSTSEEIRGMASQVNVMNKNILGQYDYKEKNLNDKKG